MRQNQSENRSRNGHVLVWEQPDITAIEKPEGV